MSNHVYQFIDVYKSTFVKIFMCVDSEKTSVMLCQLQYQVSKYHWRLKRQKILLDILKHHRNSHRPGIHQSVHLNKSIFCMLVFTLSRLKGPQKILDTTKGFGTLLCRQYQYLIIIKLGCLRVFERELRVKVHCCCQQLLFYCYFCDAGGGLLILLLSHFSHV